MFVLMLSVIQFGWTGLMRASEYGHTSTVRILLEAKADPNITDEVKLHYSHCLYNSTIWWPRRARSIPNFNISNYQF